MAEENTEQLKETGQPFSLTTTATLSIIINKLKIVDCADDDEDMNIRLAIYVTGTGGEARVFAKSYDDVYVEEEGKIGNDSRCTFFAGERVTNLADVTRVKIGVFLETLDGDGFDWKGHHDHIKEVANLSLGDNTFVEGKQHSHNTECEGVYELNYSIVISPVVNQ
ncbi:MAG: hypothetical protein AABO57_23770 [Acidobacteriota bacterium]